MRIPTYSSCLVFLFVCTFPLQSQEILSGIEVNQSVRNLYKKSPRLKKSAGLLELPFFDDFSSTKIFPDADRWSDRSAFINSDYPVDPVSLGVATLDAIDHTGALYENASVWPFIADQLTSRPLNLNYSPADSLYLSFFYQPQGKGDTPQSQDSLRLEFYSPENDSWSQVWAVPGENLHEFKLVMIPIIEAGFLTEGFRFRFSNKASIADNRYNPGAMGNGDHWHIDYVYLDKNRTFADTVFRDVAIVRPLKSILNNYQSMPWNHFLAARLSEMGSQLSITYRNNDNVSRNVKRDFSIYDVYENRTVHSFSGGTTSIGARQTHEYQPDLAYSFNSTVSDSALFKITAWLETGGFDHKGNDTVSYNQKFSNYFALDDGTSENGYGLYGGGTENASLAYRFNAFQPDSLRAIQIYFNQSLNHASRAYFKLAVWDEVGGRPGNLLYTQEGARPTYEGELNQFHTFHLESAVFVSGSFYVGLIQTAPDFLNIGFDINTNNSSRIFYNIFGEWKNTSFEGSLMIRPVVGEVLSSAPVSDRVQKRNLKVYPNPAVNVLYIDLEPEFEPGTITYKLFNRMGQLVYQSTGHVKSIDLKSLPPGIYFLHAESGHTDFETRKILISH
jgi:hypothetical protein